MGKASNSFISYEEELLLSDALRRRREHIQNVNDGVEEPDEAIEQEGARAAHQLITAYIPFIRAVAHGYYLEYSKRGNLIDFDDLMSIGTIAAYTCAWSFNARGKGDHPGVRFSTYSRRHIIREIHRAVTKGSTPFYANVYAISSTWMWLSTKDELTVLLRREPTEQEIYDRCGIWEDDILRNLPSSVTVGTLDAPESVQVAGDDDFEDSLDLDSLFYNELLVSILEWGLSDRRELRVAVCLLGLDTTAPRHVSDVAKILGMRRSAVTRIEAKVYDVLRHPRTRAYVRKTLKNADQSEQIIA